MPRGILPACGPKSLHAALLRLGIEASLPDLIRRCRTSPRGTAIRDLVAAAESFGLGVEVCGADLSLLLRLVSSAHIVVIAHVRGNHFVLIDSITEREACFWDPDAGTRGLSLHEFLEAWEGVCIVVASPHSV